MPLRGPLVPTEKHIPFAFYSSLSWLAGRPWMFPELLFKPLSQQRLKFDSDLGILPVICW